MHGRQVRSRGRHRSGRCNDVRELIDGPLYQLALLLLVASPLPGRALAVVHEAKEPTRAGMAATLPVWSTSVPERDGVVPAESRSLRAPKARPGRPRRTSPRVGLPVSSNASSGAVIILDGGELGRRSDQ